MNSQIGRSFPKHPNFFKFIECLQQHEYTKTTSMKKLIENCPENQMERKHHKDKERDEKIKYFSSLFMKKEINLRMFLEAMANKDILPPNGSYSKY